MSRINSIDVRKWMLDVRLRQTRICRDLNRAASTVSMVLSGKATSRPIVDYLKAMGCPEEFLGLKENPS